MSLGLLMRSKMQLFAFLAIVGGLGFALQARSEVPDVSAQPKQAPRVFRPTHTQSLLEMQRADEFMGGLSCEERHNAIARDAVELIPEPFQKGCVQDSDCAIVPISMSCQKSCGTAVLRSRVEAVQQRYAALDRLFCGKVNECGAMLVDCLPAEAVCRRGFCRVAPASAH